MNQTVAKNKSGSDQIPQKENEEKIKVINKIMSSDAAFIKGVEFVADAFFIYFLIIAYCLWELKKEKKENDEDDKFMA